MGKIKKQWGGTTNPITAMSSNAKFFTAAKGIGGDIPPRLFTSAAPDKLAFNVWIAGIVPGMLLLRAVDG